MAKTKTTEKKTPTKKAPAKKTAKKKSSPEVKVDRRVKTERREPTDRRQETVAVAVESERRANPERRKVSRRRQIDPTTCERDYNGQEIEFMQALDAYKRAAGRMFPTCSEILEVLRDLGYRRLTPEEVAILTPPAVESEGGQSENAGEVQDLLEEDSDDELTEDSLEDFEE